MPRTVEIRSDTLDPGTRDAFDALMRGTALREFGAGIDAPRAVA